MNQTPLMAAADAGNVALVEALVERGANRDAADQYGRKALHIALDRIFNPGLEVRLRSASGEALWQPVFATLNLPLIAEVADAFTREVPNRYLTMAGMPACPVPIMAQPETERREQERRREREERQRSAAYRSRKRPKVESPARDERPSALPDTDRQLSGKRAPWGTPEARPEAMMELQLQNERRAKEHKDEE